MRIWNQHLIEKFKREHSGSRIVMQEWIDKVLKAEWSSPVDVKKMFSTASFVKQFVVFNVGGNKYRVLTEILYRIKTVTILKVDTHAGYDRWKL
jgi:mRNA interferase HigB